MIGGILIRVSRVNEVSEVKSFRANFLDDRWWLGIPCLELQVERKEFRFDLWRVRFGEKKEWWRFLDESGMWFFEVHLN